MVWFLDSRLYFVHIECWYPRMCSGVKGIGLLDTLPKARVFAGEPEMFVSVNLPGLETCEEHARE